MSDELREHGADWSDWSEDHPEEGPSCRCGYNGSPEECVASRDELRDGGYTPTIVDVQSYYVMARRSELPPQPQDLTPLSREFDRALEAEVVRRVAEAKAEAWDEGYESAHAVLGRHVGYQAQNPYRQEGESNE